MEKKDYGSKLAGAAGTLCMVDIATCAVAIFILLLSACRAPGVCMMEFSSGQKVTAESIEPVHKVESAEKVGGFGSVATTVLVAEEGGRMSATFIAAWTPKGLSSLAGKVAMELGKDPLGDSFKSLAASSWGSMPLDKRLQLAEMAGVDEGCDSGTRALFEAMSKSSPQELEKALSTAKEMGLLARGDLPIMADLCRLVCLYEKGDVEWRDSRFGDLGFRGAGQTFLAKWAYAIETRSDCNIEFDVGVEYGGAKSSGRIVVSVPGDCRRVTVTIVALDGKPVGCSVAPPAKLVGQLSPYDTGGK